MMTDTLRHNIEYYSGLEGVRTIDSERIIHILHWLENSYGYWGDEDEDVIQFLLKYIKPRMDKSAFNYISDRQRSNSYRGHGAWWIEVLAENYGMTSEEYNKFRVKWNIEQYYCYYFEDRPKK